MIGVSEEQKVLLKVLPNFDVVYQICKYKKYLELIDEIFDLQEQIEMFINKSWGIENFKEQMYLMVKLTDKKCFLRSEIWSLIKEGFYVGTKPECDFCKKSSRKRSEKESVYMYYCLCNFTDY